MASYFESVRKAVSRIAKQAADQGLTYTQALALVQANGYKAIAFYPFSNAIEWQEYVKTQKGA